MAGEVQQLAVGPWTALLSRVYSAGPIDGGAVAITALVARMLQLALVQRTSPELDNDIVRRTLEPWDKDAEALQMRVGRYVEWVRQAVDIEEPSTRALSLQAYVAEPILRGRIPGEFFEGLPELAKRGVRFDAAGNGRVLGGDAGKVASLWNQVVYAMPGAQAVGLTASAVGDALTAIAVELEESAPGEDATAADAVVGVVRSASQNVGELVKAASSKALLYVGGGIAAGLALYLLLKR